MRRMEAPTLYGMALAALAVLAVGGCEDSAKQPVRAYNPSSQHKPERASTSTTSASKEQAPAALPQLPLMNPASKLTALVSVREGKQYLIAKVEEKFASGEQNFKA